MFDDLDWPLNASRGLSAIAEFLFWKCFFLITAVNNSADLPRSAARKLLRREPQNERTRLGTRSDHSDTISASLSDWQGGLLIIHHVLSWCMVYDHPLHTLLPPKVEKHYSTRPAATVINFHVKLLHLTKAISFIVYYIVIFYRLRLLIDISIF